MRLPLPFVFLLACALGVALVPRAFAQLPTNSQSSAESALCAGMTNCYPGGPTMLTPYFGFVYCTTMTHASYPGNTYCELNPGSNFPTAGGWVTGTYRQQYFYPGACYGYSTWNGTGCQCPTGQTQNLSSGTCEDIPPELPTECAPTQIANVNAEGVIQSCSDPLVLDDPVSCSNPKGYTAEGFMICGDMAAECEAQGGAYGTVNGQAVCIPDDYGPPTCDGSGIIQITEGAFVCESPKDTPPQKDVTDPPDGTPADPDATPGDSQTDDRDSDGNTDDADGDGVVDNGGDPTTGTPEAGKTGQAAASSSCVNPPVCSGGDPQVCALLRQQWEAMCRTPDMLEEADPNQSAVFGQRVSDAMASFMADDTLTEAVGDTGAPGYGPVGGAELSTWHTFVDELIPGAGACTALTFDFPDHPLELGCDVTNRIKAIFGWVLYILTALYIFFLVTKPLES